MRSGEAIDSVRAQTLPAHEIVLVIDHAPELLAGRGPLARRPRRRQPRAAGALRGPQHAASPRAAARWSPSSTTTPSPPPDWLERLAGCLRRPARVLGVGGDGAAALARGPPALVSRRVRLGRRMHPLRHAGRAAGGPQPGRRQHVVPARRPRRGRRLSPRARPRRDACRPAARRPTSASVIAERAPGEPDPSTTRRPAVDHVVPRLRGRLPLLHRALRRRGTLEGRAHPARRQRLRPRGRARLRAPHAAARLRCAACATALAATRGGAARAAVLGSAC